MILTIKLIDIMDRSINVGLAIEQRINELGITKSEFGRRIGIPNQNVNRVLSKSSIDSDKLVEICNALDYDFFKLFSSSVEETKTSLLNILKLKAILKEKGIGEIKLASMLGISRSDVEAIMEGNDLTLGLVERIAEVLGIKPAELINGASVTAAAPAKADHAMYEELIALRAENKLLREIQGLSARSQVHVG